MNQEILISNDFWNDDYSVIENHRDCKRIDPTKMSQRNLSSDILRCDVDLVRDGFFENIDDPHAPIPVVHSSLSPQPTYPLSKQNLAQSTSRPGNTKEFDTNGILNHVLDLMSNTNSKESNNRVTIELEMSQNLDDIEDDLSAAEFHPEPTNPPVVSFSDFDVDMDDEISLAEFNPFQA